MKAAFYTLGCKVNQYDTQTMQALFLKAGHELVPFGQEADVTVINTCTVTATGDKKSRQMISRARAASPNGVVVVAGCYAQTAPQAVLDLPGVYVALGNQNRGAVVSLAERAFYGREKIDAVSDIFAAREFEELPAQPEEKTRATLKIQDGCNRFCSYCAIPYARGPVRSRSLENVVKEVERLCGLGYREFVLTGIHLASYGVDCGHTLLDAIRAVSALPDVRRVRLGSLEPHILTREFCAEAAKNPKLCRQFHVSLQSGCGTVLSRMNRRYTPEEYEAGVALCREAMPEAAITTDVIAGFPQETGDEHEETKAFLRRVGFARLHVFPYSRREGTRAAALPDLPKAVKEARAKELIALGKEMTAEYLNAALGSVQEVLFEEPDGQGRMCGYTGTYIHTAVEAERVRQGDILPVKLVRREGETVVGIPVGSAL